MSKLIELNDLGIALTMAFTGIYKSQITMDEMKQLKIK